MDQHSAGVRHQPRFPTAGSSTQTDGQDGGGGARCENLPSSSACHAGSPRAASFAPTMMTKLRLSSASAARSSSSVAWRASAEIISGTNGGLIAKEPLRNGNEAN